MRKKLCWILAGIMVLSAAMLGGCGSGSEKLTAESILEQVNENMEKVQSVRGDMVMNMDMKISESGLSMSLTVGLDCDLEMTVEPEVLHMTGKMDMSLLGLSMDMETYSVTEGNQTITYTKMNNEWTKSEEDADESAVSGMGDFFDAFNAESGLNLQEETEKLGDKEVYVLTAEASGDELNSFMGDMDAFTEGIGEVDLSAMKANITLKVYKDDMLPASVGFEVTETGGAIESDGVSLEINGMTVEMNYTEFDTIESIEIPSEALGADAGGEALAAELAEEALTGSGDIESLADDVDAELLAGLQGLYAQAPEYDYMGIGYYFDGLEDDAIRDGYVPYDESFVQTDLESLTGANHGISIRLSMTRADSASEALNELLEDYTARLKTQGMSVVDSEVPSTADDDTVGVLPVLYLNSDNVQVVTVLYADIRDDGDVYMRAEIEMDQTKFDDTTEALLAEIDDAYGLTLSSLFIEE